MNAPSRTIWDERPPRWETTRKEPAQQEAKEKSEENLLSALPDAPVYQKNMYKINRWEEAGAHQAKNAYIRMNEL